MKSIFILFLIVLNLHANTEACKTDVYFGNGVWNDREDAKESMKKLKEFVQIENPNFFSVSNEDVTYSIKYMHNKTDGKIEDLIETYWQLYVNGQVSEGYFTFVARVLNVLDFNFDFQAKIKDIINNYHLNLTEMDDRYRKESFDLNHNVLLVAHSQGNLFGNQLYNTLSTEEKKRFTMVSVGTPASHVLGNTSSSNASYTTLNGDYLIKSISNSLPSNTDGFGHTFVDSYLATGNFTSRANIIQDINDAVNFLGQNSCTQYKHFRWIAYMCSSRQSTELEVDIYGTKDVPSSQISSEELVVSDVRERISLQNGSCPLNGWDYRTGVSQYDKNGCTAYTFDDTSGNYHSLDYIASQTYDNDYTCTQYNMDPGITENLRSLQK